MSWIQCTNFKRILYCGTFLLILHSVKSEDNSAQRNTDSIQNFNSLNASCKLPSNSSTTTKICLTPGCIDSASYLLSSMDKSVDPCEDFYQFSCGGWMKKHRIPEDQNDVSVLTELYKKIANDLILLLEEKIKGSEAYHVKKTKKIYKSCKKFRGIKDAGYEPLVRFLKPIIRGPLKKHRGNIRVFSEVKYDWMESLRLIRKAGFSHNFPLKISVFGDHIVIDNPEIKFKELLDGSFFNESFDIRNSPQALSNREKMRRVGYGIGLDMNSPVNEQRLQDVNIMDGIFSLFTWSSLLPPGLQIQLRPCLFRALTPRNGKDLQYPAETYRKIMFCIERLKIRTEIYINKKKRRDVVKRYEYTVKELQEISPEIDWLKFFNTLFDEPIDENEILLIPEITPIRYVAKFMKGTHKGSILVYYFWHVSKKYDDIVKELAQKEENRVKKCFWYIAKYMTMPLGSIYIKRYFKEEKKAMVPEIVNYIKNEFVNKLKSKVLIKADHKKKMKKKVRGIKVKADYPEELVDKVISYLYKDLKSATGYIDNHMKLEKLETDRKFSNIRKQKAGWKYFTISITGDITYNLSNDIINLPLGRFQSPYFDTNRPQYLNFGGLGSAIGHEIVYIFNHKGSHRDRNLEPWWGTAMEHRYNYSIRCIIEQYRNYTEQMKLKPYRIKTTDRDLADNLGLKLAYQAYLSWVKDHGTEAHLPGLEEYTPKQLFWISAASGMCGKYKQKNLGRVKQPTQWFLRVLGSVSNSPEFANDFKCRVGSKMNPEQKCQFWRR